MSALSPLDALPLASALLPFTVTVMGLAGACIGSFLNVVIWRLPRGENLAHPGSHCPRCNRPIRWTDNLPILSWLLLRARCRHCRAPISARYPAVEALTALLFVLAGLRLGAEPVNAAVVALLLAALVAVTFIDIDHRIIPDAITKPGMLLALGLAVLPAVTLHPGDWIHGLKPGLNRLLHAGAGVLTGLLVVYGVRLLGTLILKKEAMGQGDAKLLGLIGGFTGPLGALYALTLACLGGVFVHGLVVLLGRGKPKPLALTLRGARGAALTVDRAWVTPVGRPPERGGVPPAFRLELPPGSTLPEGPLAFEALLPKVRVLMDEDVTVKGAAEAAPERGGRAAILVRGLPAEQGEHLSYFAASHRYLPFGPYLALGGAAAALYAADVHHFLTVTYPAWAQSLLR